MQSDEYRELGQALRDGNLDDLPISERDRLLLAFVGTLTEHAYRITDQQVEELRRAGWTDEQIAEAVYDAALFNLFVRLADAFDIHPPEFMDDEIPRAVTHDPTPRDDG